MQQQSFRISLWLILSLLALLSCQPSAEKEEYQSYGELPIMDVQLVNEFGEDGNYYPSMLNDLLVLADSSLIVSDHGPGTIERFSPQGHHVSTIARQGEGPGELNPFFFMHKLGDSVFVAKQQMTNRMDFFNLTHSGDVTYSHSVLPQQTSVKLEQLFPRNSTQIYATTQRDWFNIELELSDPQDYHLINVMVLNHEFEVISDSLHQLQLPNPHIFRSQAGGVSVYKIPFRHIDKFVAVADGKYWIARSQEQSFVLYNSGHQPIHNFRLNIRPRVASKDELDNQLRNTQQDRRQEIMARVEKVKPTFRDIWANEKFLLMLTDTIEDEREYVLVDADGNLRGRFLLPVSVRIKYFGRDHFLATNYDQESGYSIRRYSIDI